jgi:uncharacterized protein (TIGR02996 family)
MNEEAAFIAALVADPSDRTAALVFADWLDERGDPRGAMLRIEKVRAWMAPTYENPLPKLRAALDTGKGVTEATKIYALIGEPVVPELVSLLAHEAPIVRLRAVKVLRLMASKAKAATPALMELVRGTNKEDYSARNEAIRLLGVMRVKQTAKEEFAKGLDSADAAERLAAVEAMAKLRTKTAADSLCKALADSSEPVRRAAAQQLHWIASPPMTFAVEPLRKALADKDADIRSFAVVALGKIGPKAAAAVPDLLRLLKGAAGKAPGSMIEALGQIGAGNPDVLEVLLATLRDPKTQNKSICEITKWPTLPASAAPALLELVRNPNSGSAYSDRNRSSAGLKLLGRIDPPTPEVLDEFRSQLAVKGNASAAALALEELGPRAAVLLPELTKALYRRNKNADPQAVAKAIGKCGAEGAAVLIEALDYKPTDKDDPIPLAVIGGLSAAGPAAISALPQLRARLRKNARGRPAVVAAIAALGPDAAAAVPELVTVLLGDCDIYEVRSVATALRSFGPAVLPFVPRLSEVLLQAARAENHPPVIELLTALVPHGADVFATLRTVLQQATDSDFYGVSGYQGERLRTLIAGAAIAGLAALGPTAEPAVPDLVRADQTLNNATLRAKVLDAYGAIGGAAVPHIRAALADRYRDVRLAAIKALSATGDESADSQEALRQLETDSNRMVRLRVAGALQKMGTRKRKRK